MKGQAGVEIFTLVIGFFIGFFIVGFLVMGLSQPMLDATGESFCKAYNLSYSGIDFETVNDEFRFVCKPIQEKVDGIGVMSWR